MKMRKYSLLSLAIALFFTLPASVEASPQQQATPEPIYVPRQLLLDVSVALDKCFDGAIHYGFVPCGSPSGTDPIPWDIAYPQTIQYFDFSLSTDAYFGSETHLVITDEFNGRLGIRLQRWDDTSGSWVLVGFCEEEGTYNDHGEITGNFDPDWASKVEYNPNCTIHPAGKYRIMVWEEVYKWNGDTRGYKRSQGSIKIYAFENTPPPAIPTPNPELTPPIPPDPAITETVVPEITVTPELGDSIVLKASLEGKGGVTQTVPNSANFAVVALSGIVTDQDGNGVSGASIEVVSGADSALTMTNPDGSYSFTVNAPGGQGSGAFQGVNFVLQIADLSIDRIVLLQAIEGGQLVTYRDVGARVFLNWGLDQPVDVEVTITVDNQTLPAVKGVAKKDYTQLDKNRGTDAINIVIPKDRFPSWGDSTHTLIATVAVVSPDIVDVDPGNNISPPQNFSLKNTSALSILYVSLDPGIGKPALVNFAARAHSFLDKVYPIQYSWGFVGTKQVSYYLVSPYVGFMKSLDADDLPLNLGDIGIVEGGLEVGKSFSYKAAIIAVEKARRLYNSQRCKDAQGKLILPCPDEVALQAVGVYPDGAFGSSKDGFAYADHRNEWRAAANSQTRPDNVAHELGHLFGFGEEYSSASPGVPVTGSTWDGVAFQTADGKCVNMMGNSALACVWINSQTWNSLLENSLRLDIPNGQSVASLDAFAPRFEPLPVEVQSPALLIEGVVTSAGAGFLERVSAVDRYTQSDNPAGQFNLEARDAGGKSLGMIQFDGLFFDLGTNPISASPFLVTLPVADPSQVTEIILTIPGGQTIDSMLRSTSVPQVSFDPLPSVIQDQATLSWQASDADGDTLLSTLYYSNDGGLIWQLLGLDMPINNYNLSAAELPGGNAVFKVSVSDDFNTVESTSTPVIMPDQPPIVSIIESWGVEFDDQKMVSLEAVAYDLEDGLLPPTAIQWLDAQGVRLGIGALLQTSLPPGSHVITLQAMDSSGQSVTENVSVVVQGGEDKLLTPFNVSNNLWYILGGGACLLVLGGVVIGGILFFSRSRRYSNAERWRVQSPAPGQIQDQQGQWWYQDPNTGSWSIWNGRAWQPAPGVAPNIAAPQAPPAYAPRENRGSSSCLLTVAALIILGLLVAGTISLVAFSFFPGTQIQIGQGDTAEILKKGGGGILVMTLGMFLLNGGFKSIITRRAVVTDEWGRRHEKRGCGAILNGLGQLFFGTVCFSGGLGLITLVFYQEVLPWLGF